MLRKVHIALAAAALAAFDLQVRAEEGPSPPETTGEQVAPVGQNRGRERAAQAFQEALTAFQAGDFETARQRYQEAYELAPHPSTLYNLALSCERLLDYDAAIDAFQRFYDEPLPADRAAARMQQTRRLLAERSLRRLRSLPARVSISAVPDPVTAIVEPLTATSPSASGPGPGPLSHDRCETPCIFTLPAGSYRLTMQRDGYFPEQVEFSAHVGQALLFSRQLRPRPRRIRIDSQPHARLFLDDRMLGETPYSGEIALGNHRLRLERRFYLTQLRPLDLKPGTGPGASTGTLHFRIPLQLSGRVDMLIGGAVAGAGLGLMVLRLFLGEEIETLPKQEIYKPLAAATLPAMLGASVAGFAGWEMPVQEAQLLIGSAAWGTFAGFGLGLGAQPNGPLPHVLAVGGGLVGGTIGTAVYRFVQPSTGAVALFNSTALWCSLTGALGWSYLISQRPETAFYGQDSSGRSGDGGWIMLGTSLAGIGIGAALSRLPFASELSRAQVSLVDLGGALGGLGLGAMGLGIGYAVTGGNWSETARYAVPATIAGLTAGLISSSLIVYHYRHYWHDSRPIAFSKLPVRSGPPRLSFGTDLGGGMSVGLNIADGRF